MTRKELQIGSLAVAMFASTGVFAQLSVGTEIRPRAEVRAGYKDMLKSGESPNEIVTQRARINAGFKTENIKTNVTLQNVSIWGEQAKTVRTSTTSDTSSLTSIFEAWGELNVCKYSTLRVGRQSLAIEDERLLTMGNWGQGGQALDGVLFNYSNDSIVKVRVFGSYNNDKDSKIAVNLLNSKIKTFNFLEIKKDVNKNLNFTLLGILSGVNKASAVYDVYLKNTFGAYFTLKNDEVSLSGNGFYQNGENKDGKIVKAYMVNAVLKYTKDPVEFAAGFDILSGNDMKNTDPDYLKVDHKFDALLGTTRPFQGTMEIVNLKTSNAGLFNSYFKAKCKISDKWNIGADYFFLSTQNNVGKLDKNKQFVELDKYLGQEVDGLVTYKINTDATFQVGYCYLFAAQALKDLKASTAFDNQSWAWVQLTFKPKLFEGASKN